MKGKIYRVTYNVLKQSAELHMDDGDINSIPMSEDEWNEMLKGDIVENFNELLEGLEEELAKEAEKEMEKGPYLLNPSTGEKTYYE